jgi:PEP-CTERM motif-containing protein
VLLGGGVFLVQGGDDVMTFAVPVGDYVAGSATVAPEPSTWAMLLLGFVGLGVAGYRRQARRARFVAYA